MTAVEKVKVLLLQLDHLAEHRKFNTGLSNSNIVNAGD